MSESASQPQHIPLKLRLFSALEEGGAGNRTAQAVDHAIVGLILANLFAAIMSTVHELAAFEPVFIAAEIVTVSLFALEYALRLWVADEHLTLRSHGPLGARLRYMIQPVAIIDLMAILPAAAAMVFTDVPLAMLVVFRLLRFLKLARYSPGMRSLVNAVSSERRALLACGVIMGGLILIAGSVMYMIEGGAQPEAFGSVPAAVYWAIATISTVGYGDVTPVTPFGKAVAGLAMITGYCLFALPVGIIATAFAREIHQRDFVVTWGMLTRVPLFADLDADDIAAIVPLLQALKVESGTLITKAGEPAHSMYFVVAGEVEVRLPKGNIVLNEGAFFGEVAVLRDARRSADAVALEPTRMLVLEAGELQSLMHRRPELGTRILAAASKQLRANGADADGDILHEEILEAEARAAQSRAAGTFRAAG